MQNFINRMLESSPKPNMNLPYEKALPLHIDLITMVRIETREEATKRKLEEANRYIKVADTIEELNLGPVPDVLITYEFDGNNSCSGEVLIELWSTGDEEENCYDMGFATDNRDNWGMMTSLLAIQLAVQKHYELGLHKRFPMVGED